MVGAPVTRAVAAPDPRKDVGDGQRMITVWVLGDQLNVALAAMATADPSTHRVLLVESDAKLSSQRWHLQRAHLVLTSMRRFAAELRADGYEVDERRSTSLAAGLAEHRDEFAPERVIATEPASRDGLALLARLGVELVRTNQFLCHPDEFAEWARRAHELHDGALLSLAASPSRAS